MSIRYFSILVRTSTELSGLPYVPDINPFYPYMFVPRCSVDLLSILTALDMTSWIYFFPSLKHDFDLCTDQKDDHWNLNSWLEILI